jgi:hypothetical protein
MIKKGIIFHSRNPKDIVNNLFKRKNRINKNFTRSLEVKKEVIRIIEKSVNEVSK